MKANTSRRLRLAFDSVAEVYEGGRLAYPDELVRDAIRIAGLRRGDRVLEVGAGTGQLTLALLSRGLTVTALEPGARMAEILRSKVSPAARCEVLEEEFERYEHPMPFAAVAAANAFHWLDPSVSYGRAHSLLMKGRALILLWNYPILSDPELQIRLNEVAFTDALSDLVRDPIAYFAQVSELAARGQEELLNSGRFQIREARIVAERREISTDSYVDLLSSYANAAEARERLKSRVGQVVGTRSRLELDNHVYLCVAVAT